MSKGEEKGHGHGVEANFYKGGIITVIIIIYKSNENTRVSISQCQSITGHSVELENNSNIH